MTTPAPNLPTRRQRAHERAQRAQVDAAQVLPAETLGRKRGRVGRLLVRSSVLLALGAMTIAVPLSGFLRPDVSISIPSRQFGAAIGSQSWASDSQAVSLSSGLNAQVDAASRSRVRSPLMVQCVGDGGGAADGTRTLTKADTIYWPLQEGTYQITSPFSMRISPVSGTMLMHEGVDMAAPLGTPIHAVFAGQVTEVSENSRSGALVTIRHTASDGSVFYSAYLHQYMKDIKVKVGQQVSAGEQIGAVGSNGWSTGPHLHFEIHNSSDQPVDPEVWMVDHKAVHIGKEC